MLSLWQGSYGEVEEAALSPDEVPEGGYIHAEETKLLLLLANSTTTS